MQRSLADKQFYPDAFANLMDALNNGLEYVSMTQPEVHNTIFDRIRLLHCESQITRIYNSRKRVFEAIMARLHFSSFKRGSTKNFWKWLVKRYQKLEKITSKEEDSTNTFDDIKKRLYKAKIDMNIETGLTNWLSNKRENEELIAPRLQRTDDKQVSAMHPETYTGKKRGDPDKNYENMNLKVA